MCPFCQKEDTHIVVREQGYEERCGNCGSSSNIINIEPQLYNKRDKLFNISYAEEKHIISKEDYYSNNNINW